MTRNELSLAVSLAQSYEKLELGTFIGKHGSQRLIDLFNGYALSDYNPVHITIRDLAALVRYECMMMNGELDTAALQEIAEVGKAKFIIIGLGDDDVNTLLTAKNLPDWYSAMF